MKKITTHKITLIMCILTLIIVNIFTNYNYICNLFTKTKPITYSNKEMVKEHNSYEIKNINKKINLIKIKFNETPTELSIYYINKDFENFEHFNKPYYNNNVKSNELYVPVSINGNTDSLKINAINGDIKSITLNPDVKFNFNILLNVIIIFLFFCFSSKNKKINFKSLDHNSAIIATLSILIIICVSFCFSYINNLYDFGNLYEYHYTNAIKEGKLYLDVPVSDGLKESINPYDSSNRDFDYLWDASYYKGKYYCYFGVWPIISLLLPYNLITGDYLTTPIACLIYAVLAIVGTFKLYNEIIKKYFKKISVSLYIISFLFIIFGSKILWCMHRPEFYELVSLAAYAHVVFGLYMVLFNNDKLKNFIGYFLLALSVLCRPTFLFCSILILPKLINQIRRKEFKFKDFILLVIPYSVVGIITMYINYIRFGSIFDFGIAYQLTTNNLSNYKFSFINSIFGLYNYLFGKINLSLYPFKIEGIRSTLSIVTDFNIEDIGGGVMVTSILGFIILFIPKIFKYIKEKELKIYIILSLGLAFFLILFSSGIGALIGRYMLDFNYLFYFIIVILSLYILKISKNKSLSSAYKVMAIISILINFMLTMTNIN